MSVRTFLHDLPNPPVRFCTLFGYPPPLPRERTYFLNGPFVLKREKVFKSQEQKINPSKDVSRLFAYKKDGGRGLLYRKDGRSGLVSTESCIRAEENNLV